MFLTFIFKYNKCVFTQDYGVEGSTHSDLQEAVDGHIESLDNEIAALRQYSNSEMKLSSYVWLCMTSKQLSTVSIINANNPSNVIKSFKVCSDHLLCIASVPGVSPNESTDDQQFDQLPKLPDNPKDYVVCVLTTVLAKIIRTFKI